MSTKKDWKKHFLRMKQIADQNLGRAEKSEVLNEDLVLLEKRVNKIKSICQSTIKKLSACLPLWGSTNPDKSLKKLPESMLAATMKESASDLGNEDTLGITYGYCAELQSRMAQEIFKHSKDVESLVLNPMQSVLEMEIPTISKLRKQLTKLTLDMDSAKGRFQSMLKQSAGSTSSSSLSSKVEALKNEMEQTESRVQHCRDQLIIEMYSFLAREGQLSDVLLALVNSQIEFHRRTLASLESSLPQMKQHTESFVSRPMFGCSLETHLQHTRRDIAVVVEKCVRSLILHGINEEGLFRVPSSSTKVRKLKAGFDANIVNMDDYQDDSHCVAAVFKSYLRELPEPLMTFELYDDWMHIMKLPGELRQNALWVVVDKLPKPNYNNLRYIIKFLAKLAANSDCNKMSPSNIAIVIGPNLLWPPGDNGPSVLTATNHSAIIEILINKSEWFFPGELDFGVSESDLGNSLRNRLRDGSVNGQSLSSSSSSSKLTPAYVSKHRFFGSIFDDSDRSSLNLSPSKTRLSLNSLTSLNDDESGFERKYSFSSLLEERLSNWGSENGSFKWRKSPRVENGQLSLNNSFSYTNRSPVSSFSTSPAVSTTANNVMASASSPLASVSKASILSVDTTSTNSQIGFGPSLAVLPRSTTASGTSPSCESVTFSSTTSSLPDDPVLVHWQAGAGEDLAETLAFIRSKADTRDSLNTQLSFSPVCLSLDTSADISSILSSRNPAECSPAQVEAALTCGDVFHKRLHRAKQELTTEESDEAKRDAESSDACKANSKSLLLSTLESSAEKSPESMAVVSICRSSGEISEAVALNCPSVEKDSVLAKNIDVASAKAKELKTVDSTDSSPWADGSSAAPQPASGAAPGKERVKLNKSCLRSGSTKQGERRSSEPRPGPEPVRTKPPVKMSRSLSASLPYSITKPLSKAMTRRPRTADLPAGRTAMTTEKTMATDDTMTTKKGCHGVNSVIFSDASDVTCASRNDCCCCIKEDAAMKDSCVSDKCSNSNRTPEEKEFLRVSETLIVAPNCLPGASVSFLESSTGESIRLLHVTADDEGEGDRPDPGFETGIPRRRTHKNPSFLPPDTESKDFLDSLDQH